MSHTSETKKNTLELQFLSQPTDVNFAGKVHGGRVMSWIDFAAYACASAWAETNVVTAYVGGIRFIRPIYIPQLVQIKTRIIHTGRSSMHIAVDVFTKSLMEQNYEKTTHCIIVMVSVDETGKPIPVTAWVAQTEEDKKLEAYAQKLVGLREEIDEAMKPFFSE